MHILSSIPILTQKKAILWLLIGSCLVSLFILLAVPSDHAARLQSFDQADSLIRQELAFFNVPEHLIRTSEIRVTDDFTRKHFRVGLPVQVSKSHLHAELNNVFRPLRVETIGYVDVPERMMTVQLIYRDKIIRTIDLRTEPEYERIPHPAELFVYFDRRPTESQLTRLHQLGITVGIILRSASRRSLVRWAEMIPDEYRHIGIWFDDSRTSYGGTDLDDPDLLQSLEAVSRVHNHPVLLAFNVEEEEIQEESNRRLKSQNITIIDADGITIFSSEDRFEFDRRMLSYSHLARQAAGPRLMIRGTDQTIDWLEEWIPRIKRGGVVFVSMP